MFIDFSKFVPKPILSQNPQIRAQDYPKFFWHFVGFLKKHIRRKNMTRWTKNFRPYLIRDHKKLLKLELRKRTFFFLFWVTYLYKL